MRRMKMIAASAMFGLASQPTSLAAQDYSKGYSAFNARKYKEALRQWLPLARQGDAIAQIWLGVMSELGQGVPQSDTEAVRWYRLAADQGNAWAQENLGRMYENGRGVSQNDVEAVRWYRWAADQGNISAQFNVGVMYESGRGVSQDDLEALRWYRLAAAQGLEKAQTNLDALKRRLSASTVTAPKPPARNPYEQALVASDGNNYPKGLESARPLEEAGNVERQSLPGNFKVAQDKGEKEDQFRATLTAARAGVPEAKSLTGWLYAVGEGTSKDSVKAMFWITKAVENKDPFGYFLMSIAYTGGSWTQKDLQKGYDFAIKARDAGYFAKNPSKEREYFEQIKLAVGEDGFNCMTFGFRQGTPNFSQCLMQMAQSRQQAEYAQRQYEIQLQQYQQQLQAEQLRREEAQQARAAAERERIERSNREVSDRLMSLSEDLLCPKIGPGLFAEPIAGCGRNKNKQPPPTVNVIISN